jgi:hypothetical protein
VDGIPFLRADRRALADAALAALDAGDPDAALVLGPDIHSRCVCLNAAI